MIGRNDRPDRDAGQSSVDGGVVTALGAKLRSALDAVAAATQSAQAAHLLPK